MPDIWYIQNQRPICYVSSGVPRSMPETARIRHRLWLLGSDKIVQHLNQTRASLSFHANARLQVPKSVATAPRNSGARDRMFERSLTARGREIIIK